MKRVGWVNQTKRHSNAKKFGHAGGKYATPKKRFKTILDVKPKMIVVPKKSFNNLYKIELAFNKEINKIWKDKDKSLISQEEFKKRLSKLRPKSEANLQKMLDVREKPKKELKFVSRWGNRREEDTLGAGKWVEMSPEEFQRYVPLKDKNGFILGGTRIKRVKDYINKTGEIDKPYFEINEYNKVIDHEGRHTIAVAKIFGVKKVPVYVYGEGHSLLGASTQKQY